MSQIKNIIGLVQALANRISASVLPANALLKADVAATPTALTLGENTVVARAGAGTISALTIPASTVLGRGATGNLAAITFPDLKTGLNLSLGDLPLADGSFVIGNGSGIASAIAKASIPISGFGPITADLTLATALSTHRVFYARTATQSNEIVNLATVQGLIAGISFPPISLSALPLPENDIIIGNSTGQGSAVPISTVSLSRFAALTANKAIGDYTFTTTINAAALTANMLVPKRYVDDSLAAIAATIPNDLGDFALATGFTLVGNASNEATPVALSSIAVNTFGPLTADFNLGAVYPLKTSYTPVDSEDVANKGYVDALVGAPSDPTNLDLPQNNILIGSVVNKAVATPTSSVSLNAFGTLVQDLDFGATYAIKTSYVPVDADDVANKAYVDAAVINIPLTENNFIVGDASDLGAATPKDQISLGGFELTNGSTVVGDALNVAQTVLLTDIPLNAFGILTNDYYLGPDFSLQTDRVPTAATDLANKAYVDAVAGGFAAPFRGAARAYVNPMRLAELATPPNDVNSIMVHYNGLLLEPTVHWTFTAPNVIEATVALNEEYGGTSTDGNGFAPTDRIVVYYR